MNTIRKFRIVVGLMLSALFLFGGLALQSGCAKKETNPAKALLAESVK